MVRVGFYGCSVINRIVRVGLAGAIPKSHFAYPKYVITECPCGDSHVVHIKWRLLKKDEQLSPEIWLEKDDEVKGPPPGGYVAQSQEDLS